VVCLSLFAARIVVFSGGLRSIIAGIYRRKWVAPGARDGDSADRCIASAGESDRSVRVPSQGTMLLRSEYLSSLIIKPRCLAWNALDLSRVTLSLRLRNARASFPKSAQF